MRSSFRVSGLIGLCKVLFTGVGGVRVRLGGPHFFRRRLGHEESADSKAV